MEETRPLLENPNKCPAQPPKIGIEDASRRTISLTSTQRRQRGEPSGLAKAYKWGIVSLLALMHFTVLVNPGSVFLLWRLLFMG